MLSRIYEYAKRKNLKAERGFEPVRFKAALAYADDQWSVVPLGDSKRGRLVNKCPNTDVYVLTSTETDLDSHPFAETADVTFGTSKKGKKNISFVSLLQEASSVMPILSKIASDLRDPVVIEKLTKELQEQGIKKESRLPIEVDGRLLVEMPELVAWWGEYYISKVEQKVFPDKAVCYATGEMVEPICNYTPIKGLISVGGRASVPFLSCKSDIPAFSSYGLSEGAIRSIGAEAWQYVLGGFRELMEQSVDLRRSEHGIKMLYFYSKEVGQDLLRETFNNGYKRSGEDEEEDESDIASFEISGKEAVTTYATGKGEVTDLDATYCLCLLSGNQGRLRFIRWLEGNLKELSDNVKKWQDDTTILRGEELESYSYWQLIMSLGEERSGKVELPQSDIINNIFDAIVNGSPIGSKVLNKVLHDIKKRFTLQKPFLFAHIALIQAYLIRKGVCMSKGLQTEHTSSAYQLGRLLAIIERIQYRATDGRGKSAIKRFSKACVAPNSVFPQLIGDLHNCYLAKIRKEAPGLAIYYNQEIKKIMDAVEIPYPSRFGSDEQMLFCLGYYNQSFNKKNTEEPSNEVVDAAVES